MTLPASRIVGPDWNWADRLRKIRRTIADMSQAEMAALVGVKPATYSAWEVGRHEPPMRVAFDVARRIEQHFPGRVSAAWVLGMDAMYLDSEVMLPRMDSNHQPPDVRSDTIYDAHETPCLGGGFTAVIPSGDGLVNLSKVRYNTKSFDHASRQDHGVPCGRRGSSFNYGRVEWGRGIYG